MTVMSIVAVVAPRTCKIIRHGLGVIVRNRVTKLEFTQTKTRLFWKGLGT